jgi:hypothetical protein
VSELGEDIGVKKTKKTKKKTKTKNKKQNYETICKITEGEKRLALKKIIADQEKGKDKEIDKNIDIKQPSKDITDINRSSNLNLDLEKI